MSTSRIKFACPAGHKLRARSDKAGTKTLCPACGAEVMVPSVSEAQLSEAKLAPSQPIETLPAEPPLSSPQLATQDVEVPRPTIKRPPLAPSSKPVQEAAEAPATATRELSAASPPPLPSLTPHNTPPPLHPRTPPPLPPASKQEAAPSSTSASPPPLRAVDTVGNSSTSTTPPTTPTTPATLEMAKAHSAVQGYRPDRDKLASVRRLGLTLSIITLVEILPALWHALLPNAPYIALSGAPAWAQIVLMLCLAQAVYIVWMVSLPDWCTVWVLMLIYGAVSAAYGFAFAVSLLTPRTQEMMLGLDMVRQPTPWWCAAMVLLTFLAAFLCGRTSSRWHRTYLAAARAMGQ